MASRRKNFERPDSRKQVPDTAPNNYAIFMEALLNGAIKATALHDSNPRAMQYDDPEG